MKIRTLAKKKFRHFTIFKADGSTYQIRSSTLKKAAARLSPAPAIAIVETELLVQPAPSTFTIIAVRSLRI